MSSPMGFEEGGIGAMGRVAEWDRARGGGDGDGGRDSGRAGEDEETWSRGKKKDNGFHPNFDCIDGRRTLRNIFKDRRARFA